MSKVYQFQKFRVEQALADAIKADQKAAGETTNSATLRRLLQRGLDNPYLRPDDIDRLTHLIRQLTGLGINLNQISKKLNTHGDLRDFQRDELKAVIQGLSAIEQQARDLVDISR